MNNPKWNWCAALVVVTLFGSCDRSIDINSKEAQPKLSAVNEAAVSKCRLVFGDRSGGLFKERYLYNGDGLVYDIKHDYAGSIYAYATMQYDSKGRLVTGTVSFDDITYYPMAFEYENNRIAREITYEPGTTNVIDLLTNTYNKKGQLVRREDAIYDLYATFEYDHEGNNINSELKFLSSDYLWYRIVFHYESHIKSPESARPGLAQPWWYINEVTSPFIPTERIEYWGDGAGGEFLGYDEDPDKTKINPTAQNFAADRLAFDDIFAVENYQYWVYENCGGKNELNHTPSKSFGNIDQRAKDIAMLKMPLLKGPALKKQLAEKKAILQRLKSDSSLF